MITKKLPLDTTDKRILSKNMTIAFLFTLLVTLAFLSVIVFFFIQNNHWSVGEVIVCMIASILPLAMINAYVDYHRSMMNSNKYVYAGIITDKFSRKNKFLNNSYFTLDGQKVFFGGAISSRHSDQIQQWDWIEVHWLPHTKRTLYIKKIKPFRIQDNVIFPA